ncbi:MAG: hypothetical protein ACRDJH_03650 [Thermomicrobiales bacterium]
MRIETRLRREVAAGHALETPARADQERPQPLASRERARAHPGRPTPGFPHATFQGYAGNESRAQVVTGQLLTSVRVAINNRLEQPPLPCFDGPMIVETVEVHDPRSFGLSRDRPSRRCRIALPTVGSRISMRFRGTAHIVKGAENGGEIAEGRST